MFVRGKFWWRYIPMIGKDGKSMRCMRIIMMAELI